MAKGRRRRAVGAGRACRSGRPEPIRRIDDHFGKWPLGPSAEAVQWTALWRARKRACRHRRCPRRPGDWLRLGQLRPRGADRGDRFRVRRGSCHRCSTAGEIATGGPGDAGAEMSTNDLMERDRSPTARRSSGPLGGRRRCTLGARGARTQRATALDADRVRRALVMLAWRANRCSQRRCGRIVGSDEHDGDDRRTHAARRWDWPYRVARPDESGAATCFRWTCSLSESRTPRSPVAWKRYLRGSGPAVPRWYRLLGPTRPRVGVAATVGTLRTAAEALARELHRLGAGRSQVQILSPRLKTAPTVPIVHATGVGRPLASRPSAGMSTWRRLARGRGSARRDRRDRLPG
jgi:hypothetical protein